MDELDFPEPQVRASARGEYRRPAGGEMPDDLCWTTAATPMPATIPPAIYDPTGPPGAPALQAGSAAPARPAVTWLTAVNWPR